MAFDLASALARLGLTDPTPEQEANAQGALDAALNVVEEYLDRKLLLQPEVETFFYPFAPSFQVHRFPIEDVESFEIDGTEPDPQSYVVNLQRGVFAFRGDRCGRELVIAYTGGFDPLPADLEMILWNVFDHLYPQFVPPSQGGASGASEGAIKAVTIPDVGRIDFDTSATTGGASGTDADSLGLLYGPYFANVLAPYLRMRA